MSGPRLLPAAVVASAALLACAAPAFARAPAASDQGSLEWILQRIRRDREAEKTAKPASNDPVLAYEKGEVPIEDWKVLADKIRNRNLSYAERERATSAVIARFKAEGESGKIEAKAQDVVKKQICFECLDLMVQGDENSRNHIMRLLKQLLPTIGVNWSVNDSQTKRLKAYSDLKRRLKQ